MYAGDQFPSKASFDVSNVTIVQGIADLFLAASNRVNKYWI
jgi:hypothetical protein